MKLSRSVLTYSLVAALGLVQSWVALAGGPEALTDWYHWFGLSRAGFLSGSFWQLISYPMLHGNWLHYACNALFLLAFGIPSEALLGRWAMAKIWCVGAVGGGLFHLGLGNQGVLVGASSLVCATILALSVTIPEFRVPWLRLRMKNLAWGILLGSGILTLWNWIPNLPAFLVVSATIGHACHFGGALAGWWMGHTIILRRQTLMEG